MLKPELKVNANVVNSCLLTLFLICKTYPKLLVPHGATLSPYLTSKINTQNDTLVTQNVCKILELIVPLMEHPNRKFLAELEEDAMKLLLKQSQAVVQCSVSCLAAIINNVTHNYEFMIDAFNKFHSKCHAKFPIFPILLIISPNFPRFPYYISRFSYYISRF